MCTCCNQQAEGRRCLHTCRIPAASLVVLTLGNSKQSTAVLLAKKPRQFCLRMVVLPQASQQSDSAICEQPEMPHMLHVKCITIRQVLALLLKVGVHDSKGNEAS